MAFDDDEFRSLLDDEDEDLSFYIDEAENNVIPEGDGAEGKALFLGMTAVERMFLSIFLFMNVAVLGVALLLATGRIG